ncbi:type II toxin-antitoxin system VapC family toxin [bacterium]|nr:type II toxin-antitoxin system VapC family toxin [bacterium]
MVLESRRGLILDTHIWIWLNNASSEISSKTVASIDRAARSGEVFVHAITLWEIATLESKGRVTMSMPLEQWITEALSKPGVGLVPLLPNIAIESARLPANFHGDPADRLIVAAARVMGLAVVTRDSKILAYGKQGHVEVVKG